MLEKVYIFCLAVGCIYTLFTFLLGGIADFFDFDVDVDLNPSFHIDALPFLPMKPFVIMSFVTVFGGSGLIFINMFFFRTFTWLTIPISFFIALTVSKSLYNFVYIPLLKSQTVVEKQAAAIGVTATVLEAILPNSYGRISYKISGNILSSAAKETTPGNGFKKGDLVIIESIIDNIYYVSKKIDAEIKITESKDVPLQ